MIRPSSQSLKRVLLLGTALFTVAVLAAVLVDGTTRSVFAGFSVALFVVGCIAMLWAFVVGVDRSRRELLHVPGLFLLVGSAGRSTQRTFLGLTLIQTVVAVIGSSIRPFTALAFGILVPMFGLGVTGLWGAIHGTFAPRQDLDHKRPEHARPEQGDNDG